MLEKNLIVDRLERFEILSGMIYPNPTKVSELWHQIFTKTTPDEFNVACDWIEKNEIKWHILPTPTTLMLGLESTLKKYRG